MIKGKWYKEIESPDDVFYRYHGRNKRGYLMFDKSYGVKFKKDPKLIHGYPGMERFLAPATKDEIKRFNLF